MFSEFSSAENSYKVSEISMHSFANQRVDEFEMDEFVVGTTEDPQKKHKRGKKKNRKKSTRKPLKEMNQLENRISKPKKKQILGKEKDIKKKLNNVENFKDAFSTMMKKMKRLKEPSEFMQEGEGGEEQDGKFLMVNGVKIYYQDSSLSDIINMNLRKKVF